MGDIFEGVSDHNNGTRCAKKEKYLKTAAGTPNFVEIYTAAHDKIQGRPHLSRAIKLIRSISYPRSFLNLFQL